MITIYLYPLNLRLLHNPQYAAAVFTDQGMTSCLSVPFRESRETAGSLNILRVRHQHTAFFHLLVIHMEELLQIRYLQHLFS